MSDDRAAEGLEHLQRAGMELIAAARLFLDLAEEVVADQGKVADLVSLVGTMAGSAGEAVSDAVSGARAATAGGGDEAAGGRVEHIDVS